jgi:hypothetical protein
MERTPLRGRARGRMDARTAIARCALALIVSAVAVLGIASTASAGIQGEFAQFADCPKENPLVTLCIVSTTTSGEFKIGSKTVPITSTVVLQGGLTENSPVLVPAADGNTLSKTPLQVPGGLLIELLPPLTSVFATAELAGPVELNIPNTNKGEGIAAVLPVKVKLDNPLLGASCRIGSNAEPVTLQLTTGTTNPPPPNTPISGSHGEPTVTAHGQLITIHNDSLVDNAFAAPGVNGCVEPLSLVTDVGVDLASGLPAAAGKNTAILSGNTAAASVTAINAEDALPELGRCVKAPSEKVGKELIFHGGYVASDCVEKNEGQFGKFEWIPGAVKNHFTGSSKAVTLETTGGAKVKCVGSTSQGDYTGTKTATLGLTLTGCTLAGQSCQTSSATPGQIATSPLEATLGFIKDVENGSEVISVVGWDLKSGSALISGECGASKESLIVTGSVIGTIAGPDTMHSAYALKFVEKAGKQLPEAFEERPNDTLSAAFGGAPAEPAGLKVAEKITNEEKLEFKAQVET